MADYHEGDGDIVIELDGKQFTLRPTLQACQQISRMAGGLTAVRMKIGGLDFDTICDVIGYGIGLNPTQRAKMLPEAVYRAGIINLIAPLVDFVMIIANGGRPLPMDEEEPDEEEGDENPQTSS